LLDIAELRKEDIALVGGKGANLGEMTENGFPVPEGFVVTTEAFTHFLEKNSLIERLNCLAGKLRMDSDAQLTEASNELRRLFDESKIPQDLAFEIIERYEQMARNDKTARVAVRSSATAEDLPTASFAGQQDTYLNINGEMNVLEKVKRCWSSLFTPRAIAYRISKGFDHNRVRLAVVVQEMIDSEVSGVMFTLDPTASSKQMMIEAGFGQGEAIVSGKVTPDTYFVDRDTYKISEKKVSTQKWKLSMGPENDLMRIDFSYDDSNKQKLPDEKIIELAKIGSRIEDHYRGPMDVEWCMEDGKLYVVQARPVTTLNGRVKTMAGKEKSKEPEKGKVQKVILKGLAASPGVVSGKIRIYNEGESLDVVKKGEILVTVMTSPDMVPAMTSAAAIVTDEGGMTCHAAIVARELGMPCIVGAREATRILKTGMMVTIDGTRGIVMEGAPEQKEDEAPALVFSQSVPVTGTKIMVNVGIPHKAEEYSKLPVSGVGLMRIEFLFTSFIGEHPQAMMEKGRLQELVDKLAEGIGIVGKAFFPRPVILRLSDFKTNEYRDMPGGDKFEPQEANPMIGWRGCSRYVSPQYREAFKLELQAVKKAREEMNLKNIWVMLPFVRTIQEVKDINCMMDEIGLRRGPDFKLYLMAEVPVIIFMAEEFCDVCDGFSIGSNDLTQLIMGADRDSEILGKMGYFDERYDAIKRAIKMLIDAAHKKGVPVGICGQAPSVYPEFTEFLVRAGIDSISLNPDTVIKTIPMVASTEQRIILESIRKQ